MKPLAKKFKALPQLDADVTIVTRNWLSFFKSDGGEIRRLIHYAIGLPLLFRVLGSLTRAKADARAAVILVHELMQFPKARMCAA